MKTPDGEPMSGTAATHPIGTALRIAPGFVATSRDDTGLETTLDVHYDPEQGRYRIRTAVSSSTRNDTDVSSVTLRQIPVPAILEAGARESVSVTFDDPDDPAARWHTIAELLRNEGRILPPALAAQVAGGGNTDQRMDIITILYTAAALAGTPPVRTIQQELDVPYRTAEDWISRARRAGRLGGITYLTDRQKND